MLTPGDLDPALDSIRFVPGANDRASICFIVIWITPPNVHHKVVGKSPEVDYIEVARFGSRKEGAMEKVES